MTLLRDAGDKTVASATRKFATKQRGLLKLLSRSKPGVALPRLWVSNRIVMRNVPLVAVVGTVSCRKTRVELGGLLGAGTLNSSSVVTTVFLNALFSDPARMSKTNRLIAFLAFNCLLTGCGKEAASKPSDDAVKAHVERYGDLSVDPTKSSPDTTIK